MQMRLTPFGLSALIILGCLATGVGLVVFVKDVPAVVVAVVLACSIATLTYTLLGGVTEAGFHLGPLKLAGSGAMLVGSIWLINCYLDPQLAQVRRARSGFDLDRHAAPPDGWFALDRTTGVPLTVDFIDPASKAVVDTVQPPRTLTLRLGLVADEENDRYRVVGLDATAEQAIGYITSSELANFASALPWEPRFYGLQRLHLIEAGGLARRWGNAECSGTGMPFEIEPLLFYGFTDYTLRLCDSSDDSGPDHTSTLNNRAAELVMLTVQNRKRIFLIGVVAADHQSDPAWSAFVAFEMRSGIRE